MLKINDVNFRACYYAARLAGELVRLHTRENELCLSPEEEKQLTNDITIAILKTYKREQ